MFQHTLFYKSAINKYFGIHLLVFQLCFFYYVCVRIVNRDKKNIENLSHDIRNTYEDFDINLFIIIIISLSTTPGASPVIVAETYSLLTIYGTGIKNILAQ